MTGPERRTLATIVVAATGIATFGVYAATAARTITWWDGSHYPLLARTLSISNPPGSLLLTLAGWLATRRVLFRPAAFQLALLSAGFGATAAALVAAITIRLARRAGAAAGQRPDAEALLGAVAAALAFATGFHIWTYATQFTPYTLTTLFTALLALVLLAWWDRAGEGDALGTLFALALLFGIDVSVHRTNQLWLPAALATIALRRPRLARSWRAWTTALAGFALGVSLQLVYLPLARHEPFLDTSGIDSLAGLWRYERMDAIGGGFLVDVWPRRADWLQVQLADWLRFVWRDLGPVTPVRLTSLALTLAGVATAARREPRRTLGVVVCFLTAGLGAVLYFNRPLQYFRPLERHYLPSGVWLAPWAGVGLATLARGLRRRLPEALALATAGLVAAGLVAPALVAGWPACDRSRTRYAERFARDLLEPLPRDCILITGGDNDSFPVWYVQQCEGVRTDVLVVSVPTSDEPSTIRFLHRADPAFAGVRASGHLVGDLIRANAWRRPVRAAVTVHDLAASLGGGAPELVGLTERISAPGDTTRHEDELRRFVEQRVTRTGIDDPRQILEPDLTPMLGDYAMVGFQLARREADRGDLDGALATLARLDFARRLDRVPGSGTQYGTMLDRIRSGLRAQRFARSRR